MIEHSCHADELASPRSETIETLWRSLVPSSAEIRRARRRVHLTSLAIGAVVVTSYVCLVVADLSVALRLVAAATMSVGLVAVGTNIMHGANHDSFSRHRWVNRTLAYSSDALGASSWLWRFQHNTLHHGNPNVVGFDADISLHPWARLAPSQRWRPWHRAQYVYLWPLYGLLAIKNLLVSDLLTVLKGRLDQQPLRQRATPGVVAKITIGKLGHVGWAVVIPMLFNPWWKVLLFYIACSWLVGFTLAIVFQLAHCVDITTMLDDGAPRRGDDFAAHQLRTTADIASPLPVVGHLFRWVVGGLDHQVEHHLAPRLPHALYPEIAARFRALCHDNGIEYHLHPGVWSAVRSHARWLRVMSTPTNV